VRDKLQGVLRQLPPGTDPPTVSKSDNDSQPVLTIALSGERSQRELAEIADAAHRSAFPEIQQFANRTWRTGFATDSACNCQRDFHGYGQAHQGAADYAG
jgi:hypothetical protein